MIFTITLFVFLVSLIATVVLAKKQSEDSPDAKYAASITAAILLQSLACNVWTHVGSGDAVYATYFGKPVEYHYLEAGIHMVNPFYDYRTVNIKAATIDFAEGENGGGSVDAVASNSIPMNIEATFTYKINPRWLWWLRLNVGIDQIKQVLLLSSGRATTRDAVATFTTIELMVTRRADAEASLQKHFEDNVAEKLVKLGLDAEQAREVFVFLPVSLRRVMPDEKVRNALDEAGADKIMLEREGFLLEASKKRAERGTQEGLRIKNLFRELPMQGNMTPDQVAAVLHALSAMQSNEALMKAVEDGKIQWGIMPYGSPAAPVWNSSQPATK